MKKFLLSFFFIAVTFTSFATHISGGEMSYVYMGPGTNPGTLKYRVNLTMYKDCNAGGADLDAFITFTVFQNSDRSQFRNIQNIAGMDTFWIRKIPSDPCIPDNIESNVCFIIRKYTTVIDNLPINAAGYTVAYQRCCRVAGMSNITSLNVGITYFAKIPGNIFAGAETNTSPVFVTKDTVLICSGRPINFDFSATDANGDSLVYNFYNAFAGGGNVNGTCNTCITPDPAAQPPFIPVNYIGGYSASNPLGPLVSINPNTGLISGTTPNLGVGANEIFAITVLVSEYRNGVKIGEHFKDLQIRVVDCQVPTATLNPEYITCDGFTLTFQNNALNNPPPSFYWDFADPSTGINNNDTTETPTHTFSDTGIYFVKLVLNKGLQCGDSAITRVKVYPGFFPGFISTAPYCVGVPVQFNDTTRTNHGFVDSWNWNFGDGTTFSDTSHLQNPLFTYNQPGSFNTTFIVTNSKGCKDTVNHTITVLPTPALSLFPADTTYCGLDSLQLTASGTGTFTWTPGTNISNPNIATPLVYPTTPTSYMVTLDAAGCKSRDSVRVTPVFNLTAGITASPAGICEGDTLTLTGNSNRPNVSWQWAPTASLSAPNSQVTRAFPVITTSYTLQAKYGNNCIVNTSKNIPVTLLAVPNAGPDTSFCTGQNGVPLIASGGTTYQWTPTTGLSNPNIANPIATPLITTKYAVSVGVNGCSRRKTDSVEVVVRERPSLQMPGDTLICIIDTLQLNAVGTGSFVWSPAYNINSTSINNPLVSPDVPTWYYVRLTDIHSCFRIDSTFVDVRADVTVDAGADTTICKTDGYFLTTAGDAVSYSWFPPAGLSDTTVKNPFANPDTTTLYTVTANIGKCEKTSNIKVIVAEIPVADAGPPRVVCIGFNTQLAATGGSIYEWSPTTFLSNAAIPNPQVVQPTKSVSYVVTVRDTFGCPRAVKDTVFMQVIQELQVNAGPSDTSVVEGEPLSLFATGGVAYLWTPNTWLNNPNIATPVSTPQDNITYKVTGMDASGCIGSDTIRVTVYSLEPDMYVPTAFTPNGDEVNDIFKPILIGMRSLTYFRVYNRFGQMVYSTSEIGKGWDGIYGGKPQDMATFVWMAEGVTYKGQKKTNKGYVVLIR